MWARFTADFDWRTGHHTTVAYLAGMRCGATREAIEAAIAAGAAVAIETPTRELAAELVKDPHYTGKEHADRPRPAR